MGTVLYVAGVVWAAIGALLLGISFFAARGSLLVTIMFISMLGFVLPGLVSAAIGSVLRKKARALDAAYKAGAP